MFLRSPIWPASSLPLDAAAANPRIAVAVAVAGAVDFVIGRLAPWRVAALCTERARDMARQGQIRDGEREVERKMAKWWWWW